MMNENWLQIINNSQIFFIWDFNSKINIMFSQNLLIIIFPKKLLDDAKGITVHGFEMDLSKRNRRAINEINENLMNCRTICDQLKQSSINNIGSLMASKIAIDRCNNDCMMKNI